MSNSEENYIKELSNKDLVDFINDISDSTEFIKREFNYEDHVNELISRSKSCKMITRLDIIRGMNNIDKSFDSVPEELYVIDLNELLEVLGL